MNWSWLSLKVLFHKHLNRNKKKFKKGKRTLQDLENELLRLLNETRGSLLEDAALFNTLQISKATAEEVTRSLETSEKTEIQIDAAREVLIRIKMFKSN